MYTKPLRAHARSCLAVVGAAALLVGGLDLASYATTGGGLVLGHHNTATKGTKLSNSGKGATLSLSGKKGPALALKAKKGPAFTVNSSTVIPKLNADMVDGLSSAALEPTTTEYTIGATNTPPTPAGGLFKQITLPAGTYDMSLHGAFESSGVFSATCLVIDPTLLNPPMDLNKLYIGDATSDTSGSGLVFDRNLITLVATTTVDFGCSLSGSAFFAQPTYFYFTPVTALALAPGTSIPGPLPKGTSAAKLLR